jgi:SAM-dependent methyltransferase
VNQAAFQLYGKLRGSLLHPQWLSDRFHFRSRQLLRQLHGALILDIGSGNSRNTEYLDSSNKVIRLDYPAINHRYFLRPDVFGDARRLPVADSSLDAAFLFEVLEHIDAHEPVLREIRRVLRPDGLLYISVPFLYPIHDAPHDFYRFTLYGIRHVLEQTGFGVVHQAQHGNSFLVPFQMLNLALLEACKIAWGTHPALGLIAATLAYPICLANNLLAFPFTLLPSQGAGGFGYFLVAKRN